MDIKSCITDINSGTYQHYDMSIECEVSKTVDGLETKKINVIFTCRIDPKHKCSRPRIGDSSTSNLIRGIRSCNSKLKGEADIKGQQDLHQAYSEYTFEKHCVLIALHCLQKTFQYGSGPSIHQRSQPFTKGYLSSFS